MSVAQSSDWDDEEASFREIVVKSWGWEPDSGIGLTTTEYARDYLLSHYYDDSGEWTGEHSGFSREFLSETPLVLFQSKTLDILVIPRYPTDASPYGVAVLRRDSAETVERDDTACSSFDGRWKFVDADGAKPLELVQIVEKGSCASRLTVEVFRLYDATEGNLLLRQKGVADYGGHCPKFMSHIIEPIPHRQTRDASGHIVFEFRLRFRILQKMDGYCAPSEAKSSMRRICEYKPEVARYECADQVVDLHTLVLSDLKTNSNWESNAETIRWVLQHAEELEARGFRFPDGFLERLPRHLP